MAGTAIPDADRDFSPIRPPWHARLDQSLPNLHRVRRGAFPDLVASDEEVDAAAILPGDVLTDSANQDVVLVARFQGHGEMVGFGVVDDAHAGGTGEDFANLLRRDGTLEFDVDRFTVSARDRHANAGGGDHDPRIGEDLPRLVHHLVLFFVVAVLGDLGVVAENVVEDLMWEFFLGDRLARGKVSLLLFEFIQAPGARAADGLIGAHDDPLHAIGLVQRP